MLLNNIKKHVVPRISSYADISQYPLLVSPCVPGVRVYIENGVVYGINKEPIKNKHIQKKVYEILSSNSGIFEAVINIEKSLDTSDIFTMVYTPTHEKENNFIVHIHDYFNGEEKPYNLRYADIVTMIADLDTPHIAYMPQKVIYSQLQLKKYELAVTTAGYDGVILRRFDSNYPMDGLEDTPGIVYKKCTIT